MERISRFFKFEERETNFTTEILAGVTTFLAMAYILVVNPMMLSDVYGAAMSYHGVFFATAVAAAIATILMGLYANYPVALASGMGVNAYFSYTAVSLLGGSWQAALAAVFVSGVIFLIISVTGLRRIVINAIPKGLKFAVGAGIGFFIAFIGLKNAGVIVMNGATFVTLGNLSHPTVLLGLFGIVLVFVLHARKFKFSLITAIIVTTVVGLLAGKFGVDFMPAYDGASASFKDLGNGIKETFGGAFGGFEELFSNPSWFIVIFTFLFIDFFDTAGTLMAVGNQAGLIDDNGELVDGEKALLADSVGTVAGAVLGTSTVTSYIESSTGIEQGGRTGLTSVVVGILFLLSILLFPILSIFSPVVIPDGGFVFINAPIIFKVSYSPQTAMALVMVGALMVGQLKNIDWKDDSIVIPAFLIILFMVLTFSIAEGIAVGFLSYTIIMIAKGKYKQVNPVMYALAVLFLFYFITK